MIGRLKSRVDGQQGRRKRYASEEAEQAQLSDATDPESFHDETRESLLERLTPYKWHLLVFGLAGLAVLVWFSRTFMAIVPSLVQNIWFQRFVAASILVGGSYYRGRRDQIAVDRGVDELIIHDAGSNIVTRYKGEYRDSKEGAYPVFRPLKGYTRLGSPGDYYTISDLSPELAQRVGKEKYSPDDEVLIRLHPSLAQVTHTGTGTVVAQLGAGVKVDPTGTETQLEVQWPDLADEGSLESVTEELEDQQEQKEYYKDKLETVRSQRDELLDDHDARAEEEVDRFLDRLSRVGEAMHATARRKRTQDDSESQDSPNLDNPDEEL